MMERTPEEERIFRALSSIQTPDFDIEEAVRQRREQKPAPGRRPPTESVGSREAARATRRRSTAAGKR